MKREIAMILSMAMLLTSCKAMMDARQDSLTEDKIEGISVYYGDFSEISSADDIGSFMRNHVRYQHEDGDHWQSPAETLSLGTGDCEDFAILYADIMYVRFGVKCEIVMVDTGRHVEAGGKFNHAVVRLPNGTLIDGETGRTVHYTVKYSYTFDEVFGMEE